MLAVAAIHLCQRFPTARRLYVVQACDKAGLNHAMSLHAITAEAHRAGFDENMYLDPATRTKVEEIGGANFLL